MRAVRTAIVCAATVAVALGTSPTPIAAGSNATFVSDTYIGNALGHFRYYGRWEHVRNVRDGRFFGSSSRASSLGSAVTLTFFGSAIRLYGIRGPGGGHGIATLDRSRLPDIDFYARKKDVRAVIYESPLLPRAVHTLAIAALADARTSGRSSYINISAAIYK